jgi:amidase
MTDVVKYRPEPDELSYTFGGREAVRQVTPGTVLELYTEDCFGGLVRGVDDLPSVVCEFPYLNRCGFPAPIDIK